MVDSWADIISTVEKWESSLPADKPRASIFLQRNYAVELIEPFLKYEGYRLGLPVQVGFGGYGTYVEEILDSNSPLRKSSPAVTVLSIFPEIWDSQYGGPGWSGAEAIERLKPIYEAARSQLTSMVIVNTFPHFLSAAGAKLNSQANQQIDHVNDWVLTYAKNNSSQFIVVDWDQLAKSLGKEPAVDSRFAKQFKAPFTKAFLQLYAREIFRVVAALSGKSKKAVLLDCDNTLWGGVIGEDGLKGIQLNSKSAPGKCFREFQESLLQLYERGVLLALCSKNNQSDVWEALERHPDQLIKRSNLAAFRVNWEDKAKNIMEIAKELNLGLDAFVMVDDDPTECTRIRTALPEVQVIQVPKNLNELPDILSRQCYFDTLTVSREDKMRATWMQADQKRQAERDAFQDLESYLQSLQLVAVIHEMKKEELARVAQLTQKTNQFNLTTRRYSEKEIREMLNSDKAAVITLSVQDKFGEQGLTGALIALKEKTTAQVDVLLLSCRVLGRRYEIAFAAQALKLIQKRWEVTSVQAEYIPSPKNMQTREFWEQLGFTLISDSQRGRLYNLSLENWKAPVVPFIKIQS